MLEAAGVDTVRELRTRNAENLAAKMTERTKAVAVINPNNPTGILTEKKDLLRVLAQTERVKAWFILDEAFVDFVDEESLIREAAVSSRPVPPRPS